jgi:hypothetical protein
MSFDDLFRKDQPKTHSNKKENYMKGVEMKKELSPKQREDLLRALKARFEKNMNRHEGLEWAKVIARPEAKYRKNCGHSMKWNGPAANPMSWFMIKRRTNTSF